MTMLAYARVSKSTQDPQRQVDELLAAGCERVWIDHGVSGMKTSRPEMDAMLAYARPGDVIVVTELSRLGRTMRGLVVLVDDLAQRGIHLRSLTQGIDTSSPTGGILLGLFAALAALERTVLLERVNSGLESARLRGRVGGRPTVLPPAKLEAAHRLLAAGTPKTEVAAALGVSRSTIYRALERTGAGPA
ncbi:MAG: recombinase family protein [Cellulomonas sp.]